MHGVMFRATASEMHMRIATWNMHRGVGLDGRFDPQRIARVIAELDADVVALQEFHSRGCFDMRAHLEAAGAAHAIVMPTFCKRGNEFGNAVLTRWPVRAVTCHALDVGRREPRNAIDVVIDQGEVTVRVVATHLGLRATERRIQVGNLLSLLGDTSALPTVLLGDFNAWQPRSLRDIDKCLGASPAPPTFPSPFPLVAFDRIWAPAMADLHVHSSRTSRIASDHLPVVATLEFP
jgi:endonuclease/exonuclease/phosphatase family metal-dependent hydrolase